jgi:hypothetical protein
MRDEQGDPLVIEMVHDGNDLYIKFVVWRMGNGTAAGLTHAEREEADKLRVIKLLATVFYVVKTCPSIHVNRLIKQSERDASKKVKIT